MLLSYGIVGAVTVNFQKASPVSLKSHSELNEKWLQERLAEDPTLLGLGDLEVKDIERRQPRAGRLDLLLIDPESHARYEVEIQLGPTDETHIIRTIEYWDIEKTRYPQYEHYAVLVAEDITSRFLNVIALFNRAVPLIAVEIRALEVGGVLTLHATTVFDALPLGTDEEDEAGQPTDRDYWVKRAGRASADAADTMLGLVNEVTDQGLALKFNKHYIGLAKDGIADNFVTFRPRKDYLISEFRIPRSEEVDAMIDETAADTMGYDKRWSRYRIRLRPSGDIETYRDLLVELIKRASKTPTSAADE